MNTKRAYKGLDQRLLCTTCREVKLVSEFGLRRDTKMVRVRSNCKACLRVKANLRNQEKGSDAQYYWWARQIAKYGLTPEQWNAIFDAQGRKCANPHCSAVENGKKRFHVDHDHRTGLVRGILCTKCNVGLGALRDDPEVVLGIYLYLEKHLVTAAETGHQLVSSEQSTVTKEVP